MTKREQAVIRAAMHLCRYDKGFLYRDSIAAGVPVVTNTKLAQQLEDACAALASKQRRKK